MKDLVTKEEEQPEVSYNITECCASAGLSGICMPLCSYDASMSQLKALAGICGNEFHKLIRCGSGGRNHMSCCERRGVPLNCLPICTGVISRSLATSPANTCIPFIGNIVQCFEEGESSSCVLSLLIVFFLKINPILTIALTFSYRVVAKNFKILVSPILAPITYLSLMNSPFLPFFRFI